MTPPEDSHPGAAVSGAPPPAVLVKGDDPILVGDAVRRCVDAALAGEDRSFALEELGGEDLSAGRVVDAALTPPLLSRRRVLVVRDVGRWSSDDAAPLVSYLAEPLATTSLVLVAGGGQTSAKLLNAVRRAGEVIDAAAPTGRARVAWVGERVREVPVRVAAGAAAHLAEHLGEDLGRLGSIMDAVVSAYGPGARVGLAEIEPFLGEAGGVAPWDLTDAIDRGDMAGALGVLARLSGGGDRHPLVVLATLHRHYAAMLRLDGSGIRTREEAAAAVGMAPFPAEKAMTVGARLGAANVARAIGLLADADLDLRGVKEWPGDLVLEVLVARLSRLRGAHRSASRR